MELTISPKPKYEVAKLRLETAILSGEYKPGDQIPSERDLALLYNISYMTVRRAILELVSDNILERRAQKGTFVNAYYQKEINKTLTKTVLNLIVSSYEAGLQREFLSIGVRLANKKGWFPNVVRLSEGQQEPAVIALRRGYSLVMLDDISPNSSLGIALRKASNKVVIVGQVMSSWGITSVHYNVRHAVELAVNHLRDAGHRDIGFVVQYPADLNNQMKVAVWEDMMADTLSPQEIGERLLQVNTKRYQSPTEDTVNAIVSFFGEHPRRVSAFLCSGEELALGILA
ncbi:GntR family transcriptional regulator, partial [Deinococcus sp.]|uniref:GntR family transcriptional regulator n=1 Tax=Deinococcus sp. TaxID=47478 RepID=UPI0025DEF5E4